MDLKERIRRRQRSGDGASLVLDYEAISPVVHVSEPVGRGSTSERLLDYLDPVFDGGLPPDAYVWGPKGSGKSAVLTALLARLDAQLSGSRSIIHTSTRIRTTETPRFVYVDGRETRSPFALYHRLLDAATDESVPEGGVGTDAVRARLADRLERTDERLVVAVDHVGEPGTFDLETVAAHLSTAGDSLAWIAIGRRPPSALSGALPPERIEFPPYRTHALTDILTSRASDGLAERTLQHEQTRELAEWAEGDAHDAFTALFGAVDRAAAAGRSRVHNEDLTAGVVDVPRPCCSLGRVVTLPQNRQLVLRTLVDLPATARASVADATDAIVAADAVYLTASTVERFLYELADVGVLDRVPVGDGGDGHGRPPSRVEPRFPPYVFGRLYDLRAA